jgi:cysteine desulfurase
MQEKRIVYADNAATTPISDDALMAMTYFLKKAYGNASQPYAFSRASRKALKDSRAIIADCIGASPDEIFFTSGGSESDNWVLKSSWIQQKPIITSTIEHHAILNTADFIKRHGGQVEYLSVDNKGLVNSNQLSELLNKSSSGLVSLMTANNELGTIQPIRDLAEKIRSAGWLFHTDAVQAVGHIPLDVKEMGVDFLSASGHKFNGPKGVGFVYARKGTMLDPLIHGGAQESGLRAGTENIASIVSMAVALKENIEALKENAAHLVKLEGIILKRLKNSGVRFQRNGTSQLPGLLSLSFNDKDGEMLLHRLDLRGISVSTGSACDSQNTKISHVLQAINLSEDIAKGTIRISLGKLNKEEDATYIADSLINILL